MILKRISCRVPPESRDAFRAAQTSWAEVRGLDGFLGQTGGFTKTDEDRAIILGLWRDQPSYARFMATEHDRIFEGSGQGQTYEAIDTAIYEVELAMPGRLPSLVEAVEDGVFLRISEGKVHAGRLDDFARAQREIWRPGMAEAPGMLGGVFCLGRDERERFFVATAWDGAEAHADYVASRLPGLRERSAVEATVELMEGIHVIVEPTWKVAG
jgi:heme-degrading monooxygenase HmoA